MQDQPVSTVYDNYGNRIDRYESPGDEQTAPAVTLRVTVSPRSPRTAGEVEAWYWAHVGTITFEPLPGLPRLSPTDTLRAVMQSADRQRAERLSPPDALPDGEVR